jgi:hypothetical protein
LQDCWFPMITQASNDKFTPSWIHSNLNRSNFTNSYSFDVPISTDEPSNSIRSNFIHSFILDSIPMIMDYRLFHEAFERWSKAALSSSFWPEWKWEYLDWVIWFYREEHEWDICNPYSRFYSKLHKRTNTKNKIWEITPVSFGKVKHANWCNSITVWVILAFTQL